MSSRDVCSFCGSMREEVDQLIVAEDESAAICDGCVGICVEAIEEADNTVPEGSTIH